jgi:HK97 family phage prohead protease
MEADLEQRADTPEEPVEETEPVEEEREEENPEIEWRKRKADAVSGTLERRHFDSTGLEVREHNDGSITLTGYASVTETPYDVGFYTEMIERGAFKRTLREDPDVQLLINHEGLPLARTKSGTLRLSENDRGLFVEADLDPDDPDAQSLVRKMKRGDIDQMSFAFQATSQTWNEDYTERSINAVSIHRGDVSVVNQAANPAATAQVRGVAQLLETRAGAVFSAQNLQQLTDVLNGIANADDEIDEALVKLSATLGVPNPDDDARAAEEEAETPERVTVIPDLTTRAAQELELLKMGAR